jgi:hypothetical protein
MTAAGNQAGREPANLHKASKPPADAPIRLCREPQAKEAQLWPGLDRREHPLRTRRLRFAPDSPLEGDGFELPVPREMTAIFEPSCFWFL